MPSPNQSKPNLPSAKETRRHNDQAFNLSLNTRQAEFLEVLLEDGRFGNTKNAIIARLIDEKLLQLFPR